MKKLKKKIWKNQKKQWNKLKEKILSGSLIWIIKKKLKIVNRFYNNLFIKIKINRNQIIKVMIN